MSGLVVLLPYVILEDFFLILMHCPDKIHESVLALACMPYTQLVNTI
jgi:hypothetical protein